MFSIPTSKNPVAPLTLAARLQVETVLIAKREDLHMINKRERKKQMREENQEIYIYIWQEKEREKERDRDRPNKPGAISSVSGALFTHKEGGRRAGGKKRRKEEQSKNILESVYKENENTHTHTHPRRLGSQS